MTFMLHVLNPSGWMKLAFFKFSQWPFYVHFSFIKLMVHDKKRNLCILPMFYMWNELSIDFCPFAWHLLAALMIRVLNPSKPICARQKWGGWAEPHLGSQFICNMGLDFLLWVVPYTETQWNCLSLWIILLSPSTVTALGWYFLTPTLSFL